MNARAETPDGSSECEVESSVAETSARRRDTAIAWLTPAAVRERVIVRCQRQGHHGLEPAAPGRSAPSGGAERVRELLPRRTPREGLRQMQDDAPNRAFDPDGDLQQALAQDPDLRRAEGRGPRGELQHLEQDVGGYGGQKP